MALDQRSSSILQRLAFANGYLSVQSLMEAFNVSRRTIYYDLDKINDWLVNNHFAPVKRIRSAGVYLDADVKAKVRDILENLQIQDYEFTAPERQAWMVLHLLSGDKPTYLEDFIQRFRISRNTAVEDVKQLKKNLEPFHVGLKADRKQGYHVVGDEKDRRKVIVYYLSLILPEQSWNTLSVNIRTLFNQDIGMAFPFLNKERLARVRSIIEQCEGRFGLEYTDEVHQHLALRLLFFIRRVELGYDVKMDPVEKGVLAGTLEKKAAAQLVLSLERECHINFASDEIFFLTTHLLGARVNNLHFMEDENKDLERLVKIIDKMIDDFERNAFVVFKDRQEMKRNLLIHLKSAYYRIAYDIKLNNPIADQVKERYPEIYQLTEKVIGHLASVVGKPIDQSETALIAMHFGGWMRREGLRPETKVKVLMVCANGVGTSRLLQHQLEEWFPAIDLLPAATVKNYEQFKSDADVIISTVPLEDPDVPVIVVSPILTEAEIMELQKKLTMISSTGSRHNQSVDALYDIIQQYATVQDSDGLRRALQHYLYQPKKIIVKKEKPNLNELITKDNIQIWDKRADWPKAIRTAADPLLTSKKITENYIDAMIKNVTEMGPYMVIGHGVAIPHAKPEDGVLEIGLSLLKLNIPAPFPDPDHLVRFVIVLAPIDDESHLRALSQLSRLLGNDSWRKDLLEAQDKDQILSLLDKTSTNSIN
ncbi:BglG family transcription antiterminator [Camelliibacillus cellulosilyticus]|uniref:BglG family transcription antiterminator n=1 Tax=Camelliibacillus cellulosilyticus TaxID=2174486 RepID=A0ABV9GQZ6_9BACL